MLSLVFSLLACGADVTHDKPAAEVGTAAPAAAHPPTVAPPAARAPGLAVDKARSSVVATGAKVVGSHELNFGDFDGELGLEGENFVNVTARVRTGSVTTDSEKLTQHLLTPDFFSATEFPEASFTSTLVTVGGASGGTHTVKGNLSLRGVSREISFPVTVEVTATEVSARAELSINRADFGVIYPGKPDNLIKDEVSLRIHFVAARG